MKNKYIALLVMSCFSASLFSMEEGGSLNEWKRVKQFVHPGQEWAFLFNREATVGELREAIAKKDDKKLSPNRYKLIYDGKLLYNDNAKIPTTSGDSSILWIVTLLRPDDKSQDSPSPLSGEPLTGKE